MNCGEAREYLFAFLDSELDASLSIELQRHLERCPDCAREAEIERTIRRHLGSTLDADGAEIAPNDRTLEQAVAAATRRVPGRPQWFPVGVLRMAGVAAVLLFLVSLLWVVPRADRSDHRAARFAALLVGDFEHFIEEGSPLQIASADSRVVANWLRVQTELDITLPVIQNSQGKLIGGRKCVIGGRPAAFAMYDLHGPPASLVVVAAQEDSLEGMVEVRTGGKTHWIDRCKEHTVVVCRRNALAYAAVSTAPEEQLFSLMMDGTHEGN